MTAILATDQPHHDRAETAEYNCAGRLSLHFTPRRGHVHEHAHGG